MSSDDYQQEIEYLKQRLSLVEDDQREPSVDLRLDDEFLSDLEEKYLRLNARLQPLAHGSLSFHPLLQIGKSYLQVNDRGNFLQLAVQSRCENRPTHLWPVDSFDEDRLEESVRLIGVANIYLLGLFSCSKVDYTVPIISNEGDISGSLHVALDHAGALSMDRPRDYQINSMTSISEIDRESLDEGFAERRSLFNEKNDQITIKFTLKEIRDVSSESAEPLICRYSFINPKLDRTLVTSSYDAQTKIFSFDAEQNNEFTFQITNSFLERCLNNAVSVEISQRSTPIPRGVTTSKSLIERLVQAWRDVKRHVQYSVEIQELNSAGQWTPVEIDPVPGVLTGGVYRLKQVSSSLTLPTRKMSKFSFKGQTKRLAVQLRVLPQPSTLPLTIENIQTVRIGSIERRRIDAPIQLDSYDDEHLNQLRSHWYRLIDEEKAALEAEMQELPSQQHSYHSIERETQILHQLVQLAEERNLLEFPPIRSGLPGSPAGWTPPPSVEMHRPILFFPAADDEDDMPTLPIIHHSTESSVIAQWNPSIHDAIVM